MGLEWGFSGGRAIDVFFVEVVVGVFEWVDFVCGDVVVFVDVDFAFDGDYFDEVFVFIEDDVHVVVAVQVVVLVDIDFRLLGLLLVFELMMLVFWGFEFGDLFWTSLLGILSEDLFLGSHVYVWKQVNWIFLLFYKFFF